MSETSFTQKLWSRQVPQLLGTYLAVGFGVLQFVEFMTSRYDFSGAWVDRYLLLWLGLIPAVALLIYYRGLPPAGKGRGWKRSLLGINLLLVGLCTIFLPGGPAEPKTEVVSVVDESGEATQRVIPASSSVQRIAIFDFTDPDEKEESKWWGIAYGQLLNDHLQQRPEILTTTNISLNRQYDSFGANTFEAINLATQRQIAERAQTDYFVRVEYEISPDGHEANGQLYRTRDGKPVQTLQGAAETVYGVVDQLKAQIVDYLPTLDELNSISTELPASALITDNPKALEAYVRGIMAFALNAGELKTPTAYYRECLSLDPKCAICTISLGDVLYGQGKKDSSLLLLRQATRLAEVLPERGQYSYKATLLSVEGEYESLARLMEEYRKVYPYEYYPYSALQGYYKLNYGLDSAIHLMQTAAMFSDREKALIAVYNLQLDVEDFEGAENTIKDLQQEFPDEESNNRRYAKLYEKSGQTDKARELLKNMMATDPMNVDLPNQLTQIEQVAGNYEEVERLARKTMKKASTRTDSTTAWNYLIRAFAARGQVKRALKELDAYEGFLSKLVPRNVLVIQNYPARSDYILQTDDYEKVYDYLEEMAAYDPALTEIYSCYLPMQMIEVGILKKGDFEKLVACSDQLAAISPIYAELGEAYQAVLKEDFEAGLDMINKLTENKQDIISPVSNARFNRKAGRYERASEILEKELKTQKNSPKVLLEYAKVKQLQGDFAAAKTALAIPLKTWRNADENFRYKRKAMELAAQLGVEIQ